MHVCIRVYVCKRSTGWRRPIVCLKLQVIFCKRATNYRALLRKMTYKDKASYDSMPPCSCRSTLKVSIHTFAHGTYVCMYVYEYTCANAVVAAVLFGCQHIHVCIYICVFARRCRSTVQEYNKSGTHVKEPYIHNTHKRALHT